MNDSARAGPPRPHVQIISKPIVSPLHDGTKCFVRDLTNHLERYDSAVFGDRDPPAELRRARVVPLHRGDSGHSPALVDNAKTLAWLLLRSRAAVWHFAFAPNPRSSFAARMARGLRRIPTLQTVVSPPRRFNEPEALLFGDIVVTQSRWTRDQFRGAFGFRGLKAPRIEVIHPAAPELDRVSPEAVAQIRHELAVDAAAQLLVYPGDLEMSRGAARFAELTEKLGPQDPTLIFVFAYRHKTPAAKERAAELAARLDPTRVRFVADTPLIHALLQAAALVAFPVDDLFGKVDIPIVLLEALRLGARVVVADEGPLRELEPAHRLAWDPRLWSEKILSLLQFGTEGPASRRSTSAGSGLATSLGAYEPTAAARAYEKLYDELLTRA